MAWLSPPPGPDFNVARVVVPEQTCGRLFFHVGAEPLLELSRLLYRSRMIIAAQVHTHPSLAFHSEADDEFTLSHAEGTYSIVLPDFGRSGLDPLDGELAYYQRRSGKWKRLPLASVASSVLFEGRDGE